MLIAAAAAATTVAFATVSRAVGPSVPACPTRASQTIPRGHAQHHFVRPGAIALRLCEYSGLNARRPLGLGRQRVIRSGVTIGRITHMFNTLRDFRRGIYSCMDDGSELLAVFGYGDTSVERVRVALSGCGGATNGRSGRWMTPRLQRRLLTLVKAR